MRGRLDTWALAALFAGACAAALWTLFRPSGLNVPGGGKGARLSVAWRAAFEKAPNLPCAVPDGWVVTDASGGVSRLTAQGRVAWRIACSNQTFAGGASFAPGRVFVAAESGDVSCFRLEDGAPVWHAWLDARFQHAPLFGDAGRTAAVWLMSQADGQLFCLAAEDGRVLWAGEPTNRSDGAPVCTHGRIAYGNCDGAVYVFDAVDGKRLGSVVVGENDQMAGEGLPLKSGALAIGTRQGNLALIDLVALARIAVTNVSPDELFVRPAGIGDGRFAVGTSVGRVAFWNLSEGRLSQSAAVELGAPIQSMDARGGAVFALAGGSVCAIPSDGAPVVRISLGDEVKGLTLAPDGTVACVADGAIVCVKGGGL